MVFSVHSTGVERPGREAHHWATCSVEIKSE